MITYVNSKDAKLFELAAADLGLQSLDVDQYLNKLAELKAISPKYVRLPLYEKDHEDEEIFEIDANARTIKVPASFSKNGVGVVSDELAETVWFKINRYFDIKDFGKAAGVIGDELKDGNLHILIQWEAPDGAKGASWAYAIDADTDPDYVYFGWALTAEHLTAQAGNIRFAVRILQYEEGEADKIAYSFATQAATVAVKASLSFDLTDKDIPIESVEDKIASRLMGGQIAHCPVFSQDLSAYVLNLEVPEDAEEGTLPQATLEIAAAAPEGDSFDAMAYKWYKKGQGDADFVQVNGEYTPALTVTAAGEYYVVVFGMKEIVDGQEYIYDGVSEAVLYTQEDLDAYKAEHGADAEPDWAIGDVKVPAGTHYDNFKYHTSVASSKSTVCAIPAPKKLVIETENAKSLILDHELATNALAMIISRQIIEDPVTKEKSMVGEVVVKLEKTANAVKMADEDLKNATFTEVTDLPEDFFTVGGEDDVAGKEVTIVLGRQANAEQEISEFYAEEGYYKITIINKLNGVQEETESSIICRVVNPAAISAVAPVLLTAGGIELDAEEGSVSRQNKIRADVTIGGLSDDVVIEWYKVVDAQDPADESADLLIEGATDRIYEPIDDGSYYFKATNIVEGTEASLSSRVVVFKL